MQLIDLNVSGYGISLASYFGDVYVAWRTIALTALVIVVLRTAKVIRKKAR